jgi:glycosyltransferase involved in cell wall biosynthesis
VRGAVLRGGRGEGGAIGRSDLIGGQRVCVVMPAYNAEKTVARTVAEIDRKIADDLILVDDRSKDETVRVARELGLHVLVHEKNRGYGGNQKTCYAEALRRGADIIVMLHPDYQYSPRLLPAMAAMIGSGHFDAVLGSRILGVGAMKGGMPLWKYVANRALTAAENLLLGYKLAEYHTGYRAFSRRLLETLPLEENSDDFVFDNQMLAQAIWFGFHIGEISCPARYFPEASSIDFRRSVRYGFGVLGTALEFRAARMGLLRSPRFTESGRKLPGVPLTSTNHLAPPGAAG